DAGHAQEAGGGDARADGAGRAAMRRYFAGLLRPRARFHGGPVARDGLRESAARVAGTAFLRPARGQARERGRWPSAARAGRSRSGDATGSAGRLDPRRPLELGVFQAAPRDLRPQGDARVGGVAPEAVMLSSLRCTEACVDLTKMRAWGGPRSPG